MPLDLVNSINKSECEGATSFCPDQVTYYIDVNETC